jgi:hypothetical protein
MISFNIAKIRNRLLLWSREKWFMKHSIFYLQINTSHRAANLKDFGNYNLIQNTGEMWRLNTNIETIIDNLLDMLETKGNLLNQDMDIKDLLDLFEPNRSLTVFFNETEKRQYKKC